MSKKQKSYSSLVILGLMLLFLYTNCGQPFQVGEALDSTGQSSFQANAIKCEAPGKSSSTGSYLLTKNQYKNTIEDLFGIKAISAAASSLSLIYDDTYSATTFQRSNGMVPAQAEAFFNTNLAIANSVVTDSTSRNAVFGSCAGLANPPATCIDSFLNGFATRILRRPMMSAEIVFAKKLMATPGAYQENLKAVLAYLLTSPHFLWRIEVGSNTTIAGNQIALTPYEVASRLAYLTTDSTPDPELLSYAANGQILDPAVIKTQANRLLLSPRGRTKLISILESWAGTNKQLDFSGLPQEMINGLNITGLGSAMASEAKVFIEKMVFEKKASFHDLLTSKESYATHDGLAQIYGHAPVTDPTQPAIFGDRRQGLLMRASAWASSSMKSNIILRGVDFQKHFLCNEIAAPALDVVDDREAKSLTEDEILQVTNRFAVTYQTSAPLCMSCHNQINPAGFALESLDPLGRIRSKEMIFDRRDNSFVQELPLATATKVPFTFSNHVSTTDAFDLFGHLATSAEGPACFSKSMFRVLYEKKETDTDGCQLSEMNELVIDPNKSILDAFQQLITDQTLLKKEL